MLHGKCSFYLAEQPVCRGIGPQINSQKLIKREQNDRVIIPFNDGRFGTRTPDLMTDIIARHVGYAFAYTSGVK